MKLLVSTTEGQGKRKNDFNFVPDGEVLIFGSECDRESVDGKCGCKRSMVGIECHQGTTTMKVAEVEITRDQLAKKLVSHLTENWKMRESEAVMTALDMVKSLEKVGEVFPVGMVIERRGRHLRERKIQG